MNKWSLSSASPELRDYLSSKKCSALEAGYFWTV